MATFTPSRTDELLAGEVAAAWCDYLETTRSAPAVSYGEVERWAWGRLQVVLRRVARRRQRLRVSA